MCMGRYYMLRKNIRFLAPLIPIHDDVIYSYPRTSPHMEYNLHWGSMVTLGYCSRGVVVHVPREAMVLCPPKTYKVLLPLLCVCIHFTPSPTLTPQYTIFPSIPLSVVPDLPLPGLTVSPPHCDHWLMHCRLLSGPTVCVVEEHSY